MFTLKSTLLIFIISILIDRARTKFVRSFNDLLPNGDGNEGELDDAIQKPEINDELDSFINQKLSNFDDMKKSEKSLVSVQKFSNSLFSYNTLH